ncbi:MAG: ABC transporter ATP-binding protein [Fervidicoccaceae archaeon]
MAGAELKINDVSYTYLETGFSLRNVSLSLRGGEVLALLGPNGSGKTTLTKIALGVIRPSPPRVFINGKNVFEISDRERAKMIAWVPQEIMRNVPLRVKDYVLLGRMPHVSPLKLPSREDEEIAEEAISRFGLERLSNRYFSQLSGGERRMISIARAYAQGTPFIVLDEPTAYLDFRNKLVVLKMMKELASEGKGILFTTHDPNEAIEIADRAIVMSMGEIVANGSPKDMLNEDLLEKVYGIHVKMIRTDGKAFVAPSV